MKKKVIDEEAVHRIHNGCRTPVGIKYYRFRRRRRRRRDLSAENVSVMLLLLTRSLATVRYNDKPVCDPFWPAYTLKNRSILMSSCR